MSFLLGSPILDFIIGARLPLNRLILSGKCASVPGSYLDHHRVLLNCARYEAEWGVCLFLLILQGTYPNLLRFKQFYKSVLGFQRYDRRVYQCLWSM